MRENYVVKNGRDCYAENMLKETNPILVKNFFKVCDWVKENCPTLNASCRCPHNPFYWIRIVVEDGKAYLETGGHGHNLDLALSTTETAVRVGDARCDAFLGKFFFPNDKLEEFLKSWKDIKEYLIAENKKQTLVFSDDFVA